jgi:Leucine-rich repeat (LRR) protein
MTKKIFYILILYGIVLQSCSTYKRSFGETFTKIDTENYKQLYRLDFSNQHLKETPLNLSKLVELRVLNLSGNTDLNLTEVFEAIPNPEKLEVLILDHLSLKSVPKTILRFYNLKHLSLNFNQAIDLEKTCTTIKTLPLEFLNLQYNNLEVLPAEIAAIQTLKAINASHNRISNSENFQNLGKLPNLQSLWLTDNNIGKLPKEIALLSSLRNLYIEKNKLASLPNTMQKLESLTVLHAGYNLFQHLPTQLTKMPRLLLLHINNCQIIEIPEVFSTSKYSLVGIILDNNKLSEKDKKQWSEEFSSFFVASFK